MARTIRFHELGGPEVLRIEDLPVRTPGPGEARIRVDAVGLNRAEVNFRRGTYVEAARLPAGLGSEAAGEVLELGPADPAALGDAPRWRPGDQVSVIPAFSQNDYPVYAEEAVVPVAALVARPDGMNAVAGAAVWMPYVTVYGMTQEIVRVRPGDRVLITAANNSIGLAAVAVCRHLGAIPVVTAPAEHRAALLAAGAEQVIDDGVFPGEVTADQDSAAQDSAALTSADRDPADRDSGLTEAVLAATDGHGADLVLDAVGGPAVEQLVRACAPGAAMIVHGGLSGRSTPLPAGAYAPVWLRRYHVYEVTTETSTLRRAEHFVRSGLAVGAFVPAVDRVFAFDDVAAAHTYLDSPNRAPGKPVMTVR